MHQINKRLFDIVLSLFLILLTFPVQFYYFISQKFNREFIWTVGSSQIELIHFKSKNRIIQELPILYNILKGSLSFVGSKMVSVTNEDPELILKPGLTGLPHLKSANIEIESIREFENYYAMHYSVVFDVEILLKSIFKI